MRIVPITRLLVVKEPWASMLATGSKTWELRTRATGIRGHVGFAAAGTGTIVGVGTLIAVHGPFTRSELASLQDLHRVDDRFLNSYAVDRSLYAWEFANSIGLPDTVPYTHPQGAVTWVKLDPPIHLPAGVDWASLTSFTETFDQADLDLGQLDGLYWNPSDDLSRFEHAVYESGAAILGFDWPSWQTTAERHLTDDAALASASLNDCRGLLTTHVRKDRFVSGHLAAMIRSGHITKLLARIATLTADQDAQTEPTIDDLYPEHEANVDYDAYLDLLLGSAWDE